MIITPEMYLERCLSSTHKDKVGYDLFLSTFHRINKRNMATFICLVNKDHPNFEQRVDAHIHGKGCPTCARELGNLNLINKNIRHNEIAKATFIDKVKEKYGDKYDYSEAVYVNNFTKIKLYCNDCKEYIYINPITLRNGKIGCKKCSSKHVSNILRERPITEKQKDSLKEIQIKAKIGFINKATAKHNGFYSYEKFEYINAHTKSIIICPEHGEFLQNSNNHLNGQGCPKCTKTFKGENIILRYLEANNIKFDQNKRFYDCRYKNPLPFDFWLPEKNVLIEYDGIQHFEPVDAWGGESALTENKIKDNIKTNYAKEKGIHLIRIPYTQINDIEKILMEYII